MNPSNTLPRLRQDCALHDEDHPYRQKAEVAMEKVDTMHDSFKEILAHTGRIAEGIESMNTSLITAATGKDHRWFVLLMIGPLLLMILILVAYIAKTDLIEIIKAFKT